MAKYLVIVESPAKVKTIKKFLGKNYEVMASNGHVRDLPKSSLGIDVDGDFEPKYITIRGKGEILAKLRKEAKKADKIYLATDPDREGEAISWHLLHALKLEGKDVSRISFNEITKNAVKESLKHPRKIDMDLTDAQQARRVLDRIVGYKISPVLWKKVQKGLSAGRVQSVAVKLVVDREEEIEKFIPEEYWNIYATLATKKPKKSFEAKFYGKNDKKLDIHSKEEVDKILDELEKAKYVVSEIKKGEKMSKFSRVLWLIFGIALIISGIIAIFNPLETVVMLAYIIGFLMIFSGISSIFYFVSLRHLIGSGIILLDGIVSTICGIIIISNLLISAATIPYFVAIFTIVRGAVSIASSIDLKKQGYDKWGWTLFSGILTIIAGIILTFNPLLGTLYLSIVLGSGLILYGIVTIQLWFGYKRLFK